MSARIPARSKEVRTQPRRIKNPKRLAFERLEDRLAPAAGNLDLSFGNGTGFVTTDFGTQSEGANAVALQSDGKVLAAGWTGTGGDDFAISRYLHNGSLNGQNTPQPFSFDGIVTTDFGGHERAFAILVQSDGKIVAVGNSYTVQSLDSNLLALARYNSDGTLDLSFGPDGTGKVLAHSGAHGIAAALQNDGKIVVVGTGSEGLAFLVARFTTGGLPDATFGSSGIVSVDFGPSDDVARAVAVQSDGKIVVAGTLTSSPEEIGVALLPDGDLDPSFGNIANMPGLAKSDFNADYTLASSVAIQSDGRIVVAGTTYWNNAYRGVLGAFSVQWPA